MKYVVMCPVPSNCPIYYTDRGHGSTPSVEVASTFASEAEAKGALERLNPFWRENAKIVPVGE